MPITETENPLKAFELSDEDLCGDALTRDADDLLVQAARAVNAAPDPKAERSTKAHG